MTTHIGLCDGDGAPVCDRCARFVERAENFRRADAEVTRIKPMRHFGACMDFVQARTVGDVPPEELT